jgi:bifunctional NMN adenylyltransferase/nudix hydrolase
MKKFKLAVVIMRAQLPTIAHLKLLDKCSEVAHHTLVLLGSSNLPPTFRNPFSADTRRTLLSEGMSSHQIMTTHMMPLPDFPTDFEWEADVLEKIAKAEKALGISTPNETTLVAHEKDDTSYYVRNFPQITLTEVESFGDYNATDARIAFWEGNYDRLNELTVPAIVKELMQYRKTKEFARIQEEYQAVNKFREAYKDLPHGINFITGDALVICGSYILLVERAGKIGKGLWALPGGFKEVGEDIHKTVERELFEETVIDVPARALRQGYKGCDQFWGKSRDPRGDFTTNCGVFVIEPNKDGTLPKVRGASDAAKAEWLHISEVRSMSRKLFADHAMIIETQMRRYA